MIQKNFLQLCLAAVFLIACNGISGQETKEAPADIFREFQVPQWYKDAKFGLWLHWGPQSIPAKGGGWYARHMYAHGEDLTDGWGGDAWTYHREAFGHQSEFGYKDIINLWKAEKFDANATMKQFKKWGARYAAIIGQHHDNYDLFYSPVHQWNAVNVGPKRDILGEFAAAARKNGLKWAATSHGYWANWWYSPAFSSDKEGPKKGIPYDGNLTKADGQGKWWEGLDPQQLYAHKYPDFEKELSIRLMDLVKNYRPDILYFDNNDIPAPAVAACEYLYQKSVDKKGNIQAIVTVKKPQQGMVLDFEKGIADGIMDEFGAWINAHSEAIFATDPWKVYGKGGDAAGGHFNERTVNSQPWNENVYRFTCNKDRKTLYVHLFGNPAGKEIIIRELADNKLFSGQVKKVSMVSDKQSVQFKMTSGGLSVTMPGKLDFPNCNVIKITTTGLW